MAVQSSLRRTNTVQNNGHHVAVPARGAIAIPVRRTAVQKRKIAITAMMQSSTNPAFRNAKLQESVSSSGRRGGVMTMDGAVGKTSLLFAVVMASAAYTWLQIFTGTPAAAGAALALSKMSGMAALACALVTMFKPQWSPVTAPLFALGKGVALGGLSAMLETMYPGIVMNAAMLTFGTAGTLLFAFQARLINVTDQFRNGVMMVTGGYFFAIMATWLLSMVGLRLPSLLSGGPVAIGVGLVASALAASNLLLDFDMIKKTAGSGAPKWVEWYSGFSLLLTMVWMYTTVLRLLMAFGGMRGNN